MEIFKLGETVALKALPNKAMRVDTINGDGSYTCSYPKTKAKRDKAKYAAELLEKYNPPSRIIRLVNAY